MAGRFSYSRPERRGLTDPWFRVGAVDIGSAAFLASLCAISILVYGLEPVDKPILRRLALIPDDVLSGQVWRLVTWPLANGFDQRLLWTAISVALLWYFGGRLEEQIGRVRMTVLLAAIILLPGIVGTLLDLATYGVRSVELAVLLIFIAEYPHVRFFFGIPAWVLGAVSVVTDILQISGARANDQLLFYLASLVIAALSARAVGMLSAYPWIPRVPLPDVLTGTRSSGPRRSPRGRVRGTGRSSSRSRAQVVEGPWQAAQGASRLSPDAAEAQAELDKLLDKISESGLESLTTDEKRRLNELSKRLR
jgi:membrane associated rhomboid family serine protease